ncbi:1-acyl-sn-glycerol-3-phosphate acyltransferase [Scopulibacillus darangshiensis]|uniref:1-acyl-sn-glycerol-3-phosphate acyltransferase n=1 Tax=Scopulibacillus darangshiensis TaxID=442528 RepID=A0A4R2PC55_9BACL|nr:lysophospholipid acyltransferase family protein [Scopulibacillus darangshiensis]TCP31661.1 1-acyl-sn-glycerol-3-phosphate acyltransferase [Scopulibacillus darangshiensis]
MVNLYGIGKQTAKIFFGIFNRVHVYGAENLPKEGGIILCSNHTSNFDPPLIGATCPRDLTFMAKSELFEVPLFGPLISRLNAFPIKRGSGDRGAIRMAMKLLNENRTLLIFPEGTRNTAEHLRKGLSGAGFFALKTDAAVVPCAVIGRYKFLKPVKIVFGKPIDLSEEKQQRAKASEVTEIIMTHIQRIIDQNK